MNPISFPFGVSQRSRSQEMRWFADSQILRWGRGLVSWGVIDSQSSKNININSKTFSERKPPGVVYICLSVCLCVCDSQAVYDTSFTAVYAPSYHYYVVYVCVYVCVYIRAQSNYIPYPPTIICVAGHKLATGGVQGP